MVGRVQAPAGELVTAPHQTTNVIVKGALSAAAWQVMPDCYLHVQSFPVVLFQSYDLDGKLRCKGATFSAACSAVQQHLIQMPCLTALKAVTRLRPSPQGFEEIPGNCALSPPRPRNAPSRRQVVCIHRPIDWTWFMAISEKASLAFPRLLDVASSIADEVYTHARLPENPPIKSEQKKMASKVPVAG